MEMAVGSSYWLLSKVVNMLSDQVVADYVSSSELGHNFEEIKWELKFTQGLLQEAQERGVTVTDNLGLQGLLEDLSKKADEAEDALDELHYFRIQDELDGTRDAAPDLGDGLRGQALHVRHAFRHNIGNWFPCFTCCRSQDDVVAATDNTDGQAEKLPQLDRVAISGSGSSSYPEKLPFDRVAMSNKIKKLIADIHFLCGRVVKLLKINTSSKPQRVIGATLKRPITSATITQNKLYGRDAIFEKTIGDLTGGTYRETLSVLPIFGSGGIGKTTFTQHLFNDERIKKDFPVRIWVCVSNNFDVLNLTQEIYGCILAAQNEDSSRANNTTNLSLLHESIAQRLKSVRFLLVLDDIWECNNKSDWDKLIAPFKVGDTKAKGNMVLVTTRFPRIANMVKNEEINPINLQGLEPDEFWKFFRYCVFGEAKDEQDKHDLIDIAKAISDKLKCSPLAAKTVGPLLRKNDSREHWIGILNKKEWVKLKHSDDDIMPALKISYDYLPFHQKKCFSYFSLFPEDHRFSILELTRFWDAIGIIDTSDQTDGAKDLVDELIDNGFLTKQGDGCFQYYMLHDLLHELSQSVSSQECVNLSFNGFIADNVPPSVRHVSITIHKKCSENIEEEMNKLKRRIDIGNLRTLMIFAGNRRHEIPNSIYYGSRRDANILKDTFNEIKDLRVLFIFMLSPESLPCNFSKLIHLRYLKIRTFSSVSLPSAISRLYHLKFLILENSDGSNNVPEDFNRLVNLRHVEASDEFHSSIPGVGKMKCLEVLNEFRVKKQSVGFELAELGKLTKLTGQLSIRSLEKVETKEEAEEALLKNKSNLWALLLEFSRTEHTTGHDAIEGLRPHPNLGELEITSHSGVTGPSWLCRDICVTSLKFLCLSDISWDVLPPFGRLPLLEYLELSEIRGLRQFRLDSDGVIDGSFKHFKEISFFDMPDLVEWIGGDNSHLFSKLERIDLGRCPNLTTLPFSDCNGLSTEGTDIKWFPYLRRLHIDLCPKLSHLPPIPYTSTLTDVWMIQACPAGGLLWYTRPYELTVERYSGALAFDNMGEVERMSIKDAPHILLADLHKQSSLRELDVSGDMFSGEVGDGVVIPSVQKVALERFHPTGNLLSNFFKCLPSLSELIIWNSYEDQGEIVLQFPPSRLLRKIGMSACGNFVLSAEGGGAFRDLTSLQSLSIEYCRKIFSQWFLAESGQAVNPFPASIRDLELSGLQDKLSMALLSNLTSITCLRLSHCDNLTIHGFNPLISLSLKELSVIKCGSVAADLLALPAVSWQLEYLYVDNISAMLVDPICRRLSATLRTLYFSNDETIERFTEEQGKALQLFTALEELNFWSCKSLQSLPEAIDRLCSLRKLSINHCGKIQCLPKCGLPTSLEFLDAYGCSDELRMELRDLRETRPDLEIQVHPLRL